MEKRRYLIRWGLYIVFIVAITVLMEIIFFNFRGLKKENRIKEEYNITDAQVETSDIDDNYSFLISLEKTTYISKMRINWDKIADGRSYTAVVYENPFGKEETEYIPVCFYDKLEFSVVPIKKKIKEIKIVIPKYLYESESPILNVTLENKFEMNKYRMCFIFIVLTGILLIFGNDRKWISEEHLFAIIVLFSGILIINATGFRFTGWDEATHFMQTYKLSYGSDQMRISEGILFLRENNILEVNSLEERQAVISYVNQLDQNELSQEETFDYPFVYANRAYLVPALFLKIGRILKFNLFQIFFMGRLGNLLSYILLMYFAIKYAKKYKLAMVILSLLPTNVFQACMYTYDSIVFAAITLGLVLWYNEYSSNEKLNWKRTLLSIFFIIWGSFSKAVYVPVLLVWFILPASKFENKKEQRIFSGLLLALFVLMMSTFILPMLTNTISNNISFAGDERGGETGAVGQFVSILKHPVSYVRLFLESITSLTNFRNFGSIITDDFMAINLACLNFGTLGCMPDKFSMVIWPMLLLLLFSGREKNQEQENMKRSHRILLAGITVMVISLIWTALYLSFTPIGDYYIDGVQARYYLPLLFIFIIMFSNKKIVLNMGIDHYKKIMMTGSCYLLFWGIYHFVINGICL